MKYNNKYYELAGRFILQYKFKPDNSLLLEKAVKQFLALKKLTVKHHKLQEYYCNGVGWIRGQCYYNGNIDSYARRQYGVNVKSSYLGNTEKSIFDFETEKIEKKILALIKHPLRVEFQGDPRGATVRIFNANQDLTELLY